MSAAPRGHRLGAKSRPLQARNFSLVDIPEAYQLYHVALEAWPQNGFQFLLLLTPCPSVIKALHLGLLGRRACARRPSVAAPSARSQLKALEASTGKHTRRIAQNEGLQKQAFRTFRLLAKTSETRMRAHTHTHTQSHGTGF